MENGDFELNGYLMGAGQPVFASDFQPGTYGDRDQDQDNPFAPARMFGRDLQTAPTWSFDFSVAQAPGTAPDVGVLASLEALATAWRSAVDAGTPGAVTRLRYQIGGRVRCVYGRPRNFAFNPSKNIADGNIVASAQFACEDIYTYSDQLFEVQLQLRPPPTGNVTLPAVWPLTTQITSTRQGVFTVAGSAAVLPEDITFYGPVGDPVLECTGNWTVGWAGTIPYDGWVRIDPRAGTVLNQAGAYVGGTLSRKTYLPELVFKPGGADLKFSGTDNTGSSRAVVRWRSGYNAL